VDGSVEDLLKECKICWKAGQKNVNRDDKKVKECAARRGC
jgi:cell division protein FtsL